MQTIRYFLFTLLSLISLTSFSQVTLLNENRSLEFLGLLNNKVILSSLADRSIWVTDATPAGTFQITNTVTYEDGGFEVLNNVLYFSGKTAATGVELWRTDGTAAGTYMVRDINPGPESSEPADRFIILNNEIYFSAFTAQNGREIWKTNGTTNGTVMVKDVTVGTGSSNYSTFFKLEKTSNYVFFITNSAGAAGQLWRTDGTNAGTLMLRDCTPHGSVATPLMLQSMNDKLYFSTSTMANGRELWVTDGTVAGTQMLNDINPGSFSSFPDNAMPFNGKLYFIAESANEGRELWVTDGTPVGTQMIKDIEPGEGWSDPLLYNAIKTNNKFYFTCATTDHGYEIWESDGTSNGTKLFVDIETGAGDAFPFLLSPFQNGTDGFGGPLFQGNKFFFTAYNSTTGFELYVSDGTVAGTKIVKDISAGLGDGIIQQSWFYTNNYLYFAAMDNVFANELWRTDGTNLNTLMVQDINPFSANSDPSPMVIVNNKLLFTANNGNSNTLTDLFAVNSNEQVLPVQIVSFNGKVEATGNHLEWQVQQEKNIANYIVERSADGRNFSAIGQVAASGNNKYSYKDGSAAFDPSTYFYRLAIRSLDGSIKYTSVVKLQKSSGGDAVKVYQPASGSIAIQYQLKENNSTYRIIDIQGKLIKTGQLPGNNGFATIPLPHMLKGTVLVQVESNIEKQTHKIIIQ